MAWRQENKEVVIDFFNQYGGYFFLGGVVAIWVGIFLYCIFTK